MNFKFWNNITGWAVFLITMTVYYYSVESTGSLWDCGEFIAGAYKLQVVHPPGAPLFLLIGRLFVMIGQLFSNAPEAIAISVNLMSAACTALAATFICWTTVILSKMSLVGREEELDLPQSIAALGSGLVAGLCTAFISSNWFSAVEGEVYAMSTFFTALVVWAIVKWYNLPDEPKNDRWLIFAIYASALSIGVHLLSLLTFPALALFYYFKKYKNPTLLGTAAAGFAGVLLVVFMQACVVIGLPRLWASLELLFVNDFGLPVFSGLIPLFLLVGATIFFGLRETSKNDASPILKGLVGLMVTMSIYALVSNGFGVLLGLGLGGFAAYRYDASFNSLMQKILVAFTVSVIGYSVIGVVVIRANADTPINMNAPTDPLRLLPYLNREQYGDRPLLKGPNFDAQPEETEIEDRYGRVGDKYEVVDRKIDYVFASKDKILFPRMGDYQPGRDEQYRAWMDHKGYASTGDNISYFLRYQVGWMYWRYFMWNFVGRQNGEQGYFPWDKTSGHWMSGVQSFDESHLYNQKELTSIMQADQARNKYYFLPLFFGLIGLIFHLTKRREEFLSLLGLFIITGIGIIVYTNQTPMEPRERDYVLVGSFFTFCIWIGMGVTAIYDILSNRLKVNGMAVAPVALAAALSAPYFLGTQNFDDHSRRGHTGARDYAANFLNSCKPNAIIFTYGDNDTYPLWYTQEVEHVRTDVRVVNLSLIAVDWYINQLRRKVNNSEAIKMSIPEAAYRGYRRNQVPVTASGPEMDLRQALKFVAEDHGDGRNFESYFQTGKFSLPVDLDKMRANGIISPQDTGVVSDIKFALPSLGSKNPYVIKDDLAILDLIASNINDRPIYFAVTCQQSKLQGLQNFMQLEGLGLRVLPIKSQSDPQYSIIGNGRVDTETSFEKITKDFKWGNFDKQRMYVDRSYQPSVQSMRFVMLRTARALIEEGKNDKSALLVDKYFEGFPNMNFPYDYNAYYMIDSYIAANHYDKAKPHIEILVKNVMENLKFYKSIGNDVKAGFEQDYSLNLRTMNDVIEAVRKGKDEAYAQQLEAEFAPYNILKGMKKPGVPMQ
jgi:hypothetical protein